MPARRAMPRHMMILLETGSRADAVDYADALLPIMKTLP